jgi:hypothetical protein
MLAFQARRCGGVVAVVVLVGSVLVGAVPAAASSPGLKRAPWAVSTAVLPGNAAATPDSTLTSEACPAVGSCVAVGSYIAAGGGQGALLESLSDGVWTAVAAPLPPNALSNSGANVTSVTCVAAGSCVAVGGYSAKEGQVSGLVETLSGGVWTPEQVSSPNFPLVLFTAVSCPAAGSCVAVGEGGDSIGESVGVIGTLSDGSWAVTSTADSMGIPPQAFVLLTAVSCGAVGSCVAVGGDAVFGAKSIGENGLIDTLSAGQWTVTVAPLGTKKSAHKLGFLSSVACSTMDSCVTGGSLSDKSGRNSQGLLESLSNGIWSPVALPLPGDAVPGEFGNFNVVTCPGPGTCVAVSSYTDVSGNEQGLIETLTGGAWTATEAPVPTNAGADPQAALAGVSCPSADSCVAVGGYSDGSGDPEGLVDTLSDGTWAATEIPLPAPTFGGAVATYASPFQKSTFQLSHQLSPTLSTPTTRSTKFSWAPSFAAAGAGTAARQAPPTTISAFALAPSLTTVSCATADSCAAVADVESATGVQGLVATLSEGAWTTSDAVPADAVENTYARLEAVTCGIPTSCVAVGTYDDTSGNGQGFVDTVSGGTSASLELPAPSDAAADPQIDLTGISCPASGSCVAVGSYAGASANIEGLVETLSQGTWTAADVPFPADTTNLSAELTSVSCADVADCVAVGGTLDLTSGMEQALVETLSNGTWIPSVPTIPGKASGRQESALSGVSCPSVDSCQAVGAYSQGRSAQGLLETLADGSWTPTSVPAPGDAPKAFSDLDAVSCAEVTSCVAVGSYIDSGGLHGLIDTLRDGSWTQSTAPVPSRTSEESILGSVSCSSSTACVAVGMQVGGRKGELGIEPNVDTLQGKKWTTAALPTLPDTIATSFPSVSCAAAGSCASVGYDITMSGSVGGVIATLSADQATASRSRQGRSSRHER